jgi:hypothetical protein
VGSADTSESNFGIPFSNDGERSPKPRFRIGNIVESDKSNNPSLIKGASVPSKRKMMDGTGKNNGDDDSEIIII